MEPDIDDNETGYAVQLGDVTYPQRVTGHTSGWGSADFCGKRMQKQESDKDAPASVSFFTNAKRHPRMARC